MLLGRGDNRSSTASPWTSKCRAGLLRRFAKNKSDLIPLVRCLLVVSKPGGEAWALNCGCGCLPAAFQPPHFSRRFSAAVFRPLHFDRHSAWRYESRDLFSRFFAQSQMCSSLRNARFEYPARPVVSTLSSEHAESALSCATKVDAIGGFFFCQRGFQNFKLANFLKTETSNFKHSPQALSSAKFHEFL